MEGLLARAIEFVWAHRMLELREVLEPSLWGDMDLEPTSLADILRLCVASAQAYSIVKTRDVEHFERVMSFVEATYRLLPGRVTPLKHMKIMFGLKTMVIMWMLRTGRGMVETVCKIIKYFPSKLPQYQGQCNQFDMFLMRKNHSDFKTLAQSLAVDKTKLNDYMMKHMDEHYGEHYAQKVEDRLLQYLHKLEAVLKGDTYIDKILKKSSPAIEDERLLLELVTCDPVAIAPTLKNLLRCDVPQSSENGETLIERSLLSKPLYSSKAALKPAVAPLEGLRGREEPGQDADRPDLGGQQQLLEAGDVVKKVEEKSRKKGMEGMCQRSREPVAPPHFCSKHQRWARNILQQCPDECSEELQLQANPSLSPPLFYSSSSTSSSQDLTPSDLIPGPLDQPPPFQADQHGLASSTPQKEAVPRPPLPRDVLLSPATRSSRPSANHSIVPSDRITPSCCHCHLSPDKDFSDDASIQAVCPAALLPLSTHLCHPPVPQNASTCHPEAPVHVLHSTEVSTAATRRSVLRQAVALQPYVTLTRLSSRQCRRITNGRCCDPMRKEEEEDTDSSFDPNTLYSSQSSSSYSMDLTDDDPDYNP